MKRTVTNNDFFGVGALYLQNKSQFD